MKLCNAITFIREYKCANMHADKAAVQKAFIEQFVPLRARSVWVANGFSMRFCEARTGSFSNTVLSLSALQGHDAHPLVVVVVRERAVDFFLANSTFLKKISHSSIELRVDNIKGSFNGSDIMTEYERVRNSPENFDYLLSLHRSFTWAENVERLVEATNAIVGRDNRFRPTDDQKAVLLTAPERAAAAFSEPVWHAVEAELKMLVENSRDAIMQASLVDNVNLRGNAIEQLLTNGYNAHDLGDIERTLGVGRALVIDIKTKLLDRASAPKAYNVDKMLSFLAEPGSVFAFLMIGISVSTGTVTARLLPVLEDALLDATGIQHHWAGRVSRGVTQLSGRFGRAAMPDYQPRVDVVRAKAFLNQLLEL